MRNTIPIMDLNNPDELIRANGAAEAAQTDRLREEVSDYTEAIRQFRELCDRNNELVQKLQFMNRSQTDEVRRLLQENSEMLSAKLAAMQEWDDGALREAVTVSLRTSQQAVQESIGSSQQTVQASVGSSQQAIQASIGSSQQALQASVENSQEAVQASLRENLDKTREHAEQLHRQSDDFHHKENVRVYRNIQASMIAELTKQTQELRAQLETLQAAAQPDPAEGFMRKVTFGLLTAVLVIQLLEGVGLLSLFLSMH